MRITGVALSIVEFPGRTGHTLELAQVPSVRRIQYREYWQVAQR